MQRYLLVILGGWIVREQLFPSEGTLRSVSVFSYEFDPVMCSGNTSADYHDESKPSGKEGQAGNYRAKKKMLLVK